MTSATDTIYQESVPNPWWLLAMLWLGPPAFLVGLILAWLDDSGIARVMGVSLSAALAVSNVLLCVWLRACQIVVTREELRYGWGPLGGTHRWVDVLDAEVEELRSLTRPERRRAYSFPGVRFGVAVRTRDGKRTHLASKQPEALCAAIRSMIVETPGDARGGHE